MSWSVDPLDAWMNNILIDNGITPGAYPLEDPAYEIGKKTSGKYLDIPPPNGFSNVPAFNHDKFPGFKDLGGSGPVPSVPGAKLPSYVVPAAIGAGVVLLLILAKK